MQERTWLNFLRGRCFSMSGKLFLLHLLVACSHRPHQYFRLLGVVQLMGSVVQLRPGRWDCQVVKAFVAMKHDQKMIHPKDSGYYPCYTASNPFHWRVQDVQGYLGQPPFSIFLFPKHPWNLSHLSCPSALASCSSKPSKCKWTSLVKHPGFCPTWGMQWQVFMAVPNMENRWWILFRITLGWCILQILHPDWIYKSNHTISSINIIPRDTLYIYSLGHEHSTWTAGEL